MVIYSFNKINPEGRVLFKGNNGTYLISKEDTKKFPSGYWKPDIVSHFQENPEELIFLSPIAGVESPVPGSFAIESIPIYEYKCIGKDGCKEDFVSLEKTESCGQCGREVIPIEEYYKNLRKYANR